MSPVSFSTAICAALLKLSDSFVNIVQLTVVKVWRMTKIIFRGGMPCPVFGFTHVLCSVSPGAFAHDLKFSSVGTSFAVPPDTSYIAHAEEKAKGCGVNVWNRVSDK